MRAVDRRCRETTIMLADTARFSFPEGPPIVFLYNPFGPLVLTPVLDNLRCAVASQPYEIFIAYFNAEHANLVEEAGFTQMWAEDGNRIFKRGARNLSNSPNQ